MKIDAHNHAIPPLALELLRDDPRFGVKLEDNRWIGGANPPWFDLVPSFTDPQAKLEELERNGLDTAVVSPAPPLFFYHTDAAATETLTQAINTGLSDFCAVAPDRLSWMASVPLQDPELAASVLASAVSAGCVGVEIATKTPQRRLDHPDLEPFWSSVEAHSLPVMIHPGYNEPNSSLEPYYLNNVIGNQLETTVTIERLICAGVLDRHPDLKLVLVHAGGYFPWQAGRLRHARSVRPELADSPIDPWSYLDQLWFDVITHDRAALEYLIERVGAENVLMGTDLPFDMALENPVHELNEAAGPEKTQTVVETNPASLFGLASRSNV
jgi:aminocarboxymuconate-semialdehyde decarboxylase